MKFLLLFAFNLYFFVGVSHAWTFLWHDADNNDHSDSGKTTKGCTKIDMPKGKQYKWSPDDSQYCIHLFADNNCGEENGWSCLVWGPRNLGQPWVRSYLVNTKDGKGNDRAPPSSSQPKPPPATDSKPPKIPEPTTSTRVGTKTIATTLSTRTSFAPQETDATSSSSPTNPDGAGAAAPTSSTPSSPPPPPSSEGGSSMSSGGIAGTVVGACAGIGLLAALGFLAYRRRQPKNSTQPFNSYDSSQEPQYERVASAPTQNHGQFASELESYPKSPGGYPPPPFSAVAEKEAGGHPNWGHVAELADNSTSPMAELPASPLGKPH